MASAVGQVAPVSRHTDEFSRLEHLLQLSCRSTTVKDIAVWSVNNPHLTVAFERRAQGLLSVDCWVNISQLDLSNPIQDICKRGFTMPEAGEGLPFATGNLKFTLDGPETHQYLLCTIAVGRSYVQDDPTAKREQHAGYDSLYLHMNESAAVEGVAATDAGDAYRHTYVVFDSAQVLPRYVVHFAYHPRERLNRQPVKPINLGEIKAKVADALSMLGPAAPAATEKMLSDIGDAYESAVAASQGGDALLEDRKRAIRDSLKTIDDKLQAVQSNSASVEEALYQKLQDALYQLQDATQRKMNVLLSEELELRRQLQQIEWSETFIRVMQETLPPMSFISAWERHAALRSHLYAQLSAGLSSRVLTEVQPDMKLVGHIEVMSEQEAASAGTTNSAGPRAVKASTTDLVLSSVGSYGSTGGPVDPIYIPSVPTSGGNAASSTSNIWNAVVRENMGLPPSQEFAPVATVPSRGAGVPVTTVEQAQAMLALAKADLAALERTLEGLPPAIRSQMESARADAQAKVTEAESVYASKVREDAHAYLAKKETPSLFDSKVEVSARNAPAHTQSVRPRPPEVRRGSKSESVSGTSTALVAAAPSDATVGRSAATLSTVANPSSMEDRRLRHSISKEADRQRRLRGLDDLNIDELAFPESRVITALAEAESLYLCLPFGLIDDGAGSVVSVPPATRLIWASYDTERHSIETFMNAYLNIGNNEPTVVLIKAGGNVFGGYASDAWDFSDLYHGSASSFLFSLTRDCKIPYTGRQRGPKQQGDDMLKQQLEFAYQDELARFNDLEAQMADANDGIPPYDEAGRLIVVEVDEYGQETESLVTRPKPRPFVRCDAMKSSPTELRFGVKDLIITADFIACSSELEASYGIGLKPGSVEAKTFLAGAPTFTPDTIEIWAVSADTGAGHDDAPSQVGYGDHDGYSEAGAPLQ